LTVCREILYILALPGVPIGFDPAGRTRIATLVDQATVGCDSTRPMCRAAYFSTHTAAQPHLHARKLSSKLSGSDAICCLELAEVGQRTAV
jgi:hypothetical protein